MNLSPASQTATDCASGMNMDEGIKVPPVSAVRKEPSLLRQTANSSVVLTPQRRAAKSLPAPRILPLRQSLPSRRV